MTARDWAAQQEPGAPVRWRALELAAFSGHPNVLAQLDPSARRSGGLPPGMVRWLPLGFLLVLVFLAPVVGFTALVGDRFGRWHPDPAFSVPFAGILFAASAVVLVASFAVRPSGPRAGTGLSYLAGPAAVLGAASTIVALFRVADVPVIGGALWALPMAAASVLGAVIWIRLRIARRRERAAGAAGSAPGGTGRVAAVEPLARVRVTVEALPEADRRAVRADVEAAIAILLAGGVISADAAEQARGAELGKLALRMSQGRPRSTSRPS